ncbi:MAG TPA: hypothetical protein IGR64_07855, partial [Leptolyngbyaceae cyanobacterium M65_K2018_010]|nr:hypothetical protein [Leptolyngbyaceae cyanobacterium M65_K2018_010]
MVAVIDLNSQTFLGHNQETYQDLRLALQLNLRRQLLIAVCDDSHLQAQLAQRLTEDLSPFSATAGQRAQVRADQSPLVTLRLDANHPDLVRQVLLWLKQQRYLGGSVPMIPAFQIVGVETLTRQSPTIQNRFLASLIRVDALLTQLDCRLLIWVPRPWLGKIQQAVPGFWRSRSGLFEFAGEPTPEEPPPPLPPLVSEPRHRATEAAPAADHQHRDQSQREGLTAADQPDPSAVATPAPHGQGGLPPELTGEAAIVQRWQQIQTLKHQQAGPLTLAHAHLALAQLCRDRAEAGLLSAPVIDFTLEHYQRAIGGLAEGEADWCDALNDLASLYWLRSQQETHPEGISLWLHRSVEAYQQALLGSPAAPGETLVRLYSNLGGVYSLLANYDDPLGHLEQS